MRRGRWCGRRMRSWLRRRRRRARLRTLSWRRRFRMRRGRWCGRRMRGWRRRLRMRSGRWRGRRMRGRLRRGRSCIPRRRFSRTIRRRSSRLSLRWLTRRLCRRGLRSGTTRLRRRRGGTLVRSRLSRAVCRLICRRCRLAGPGRVLRRSRMSHVGCGLLGRRSHLHHRMRRRSRGWTQCLRFFFRQRLSRMRCQRLLLFRERHRRRRRSFLGDNLPARDRCRRRGHVARRRSLRTQYAFASGSHGHTPAQRRRRDLLCAHRN
jgi:hypothetical protein